MKEINGMNQYDFSSGKPFPPQNFSILVATYISSKKTLNIRWGKEGVDGNSFENIPMPSKEAARKYLDENGASNIGLTLWI